MRALVVSVLAVVLLAAAVAAQEATPVAPPEIATPPGGTLVTEVNLSENDILGMIKQAIPAFAQSAAGAPGDLGKFLKNVDLNAFADAISGVKFIRVMQFKLDPKTAPAAVATSYEKEFTQAEGWSRVLYDTSMAPNSVVAVYTRGGEDFFGVGIDTKAKRAVAFRTIGFVDIPKLAAWMGRTARFVTEQEAKQKPAPKPAATTPKKPTKKPSTTKTRK